MGRPSFRSLILGSTAFAVVAVVWSAMPTEAEGQLGQGLLRRKGQTQQPSSRTAASTPREGNRLRPVAAPAEQVEPPPPGTLPPGVRAGSQQAVYETMPGGPALPVAIVTSAEANIHQDLPALSLESTGPLAVNIRSPMDYSLVVKNVGTVAADDVLVRATISSNAEYVNSTPAAQVNESELRWSLGRIDPKTERKITLRIKPVEAGMLDCRAVVSFSSATITRLEVTEPVLKITCDAPPTAMVGEAVQYVVTVQNTGNGIADNVVVRHRLPEGIESKAGSVAEFKVGQLLPRQSQHFDMVGTVTRRGELASESIVTGDPTLEVKATHRLTARLAEIKMELDGPAMRYAGRPARYRAVVRNTGDGTARAVQVKAALPAGIEFVQATHGGTVEPNSRVAAWTIAELPSGAERELFLTVNAVQLGQWPIEVVATADQGLNCSARKDLTVQGVSDVVLEVGEKEDPVEQGGVISYTVRLRSRGTKAAEDLRLTVELPESFTVVSVDGPVAHRVSGRELVFEALPSLAPQVDAAIRIDVKTDTAGKHRVRARLTTAELPDGIVREEITSVYAE